MRRGRWGEGMGCEREGRGGGKECMHLNYRSFLFVFVFVHFSGRLALVLSEGSYTINCMLNYLIMSLRSVLPNIATGVIVMR